MGRRTSGRSKRERQCRKLERLCLSSLESPCNTSTSTSKSFMPIYATLICKCNRRVEDDLRPLVKSAMQTARAIERSAAKQERDARAAKKDITPKHTDQTDGSNATRHRDLSPAPSPSPKEFATALPKRLNDIAQAPPEFKKLPRGALTVPSKKGDILPMSQRLLMEKERQSAIQRYRNLRASQRLAKDQDHHFSSINS